MPSRRARAFVLRSYDFGEADRVLVLLTREAGKVRAVAKGVRRSGSRLAAGLGLLTLSELQLHGREHQELMLVTQAQPMHAYPVLKADLGLLGCAGRMAELAEGLIPDRQPLPEIFDLLADGLRLLESREEPERAGIWFEIHLLDRLGYRPSLDVCAQCGGSAPAAVFDAEAGGVVCRTCRPAGGTICSPGALRLLAKLLDLPPGRVSRLRLAPALGTEIMGWLDALARMHLGRRLRSDTFRQAVRALPV